MDIFCALIGAFLGAGFLDSPNGAWIGGLLGLLLRQVHKLKRQLSDLAVQQGEVGNSVKSLNRRFQTVAAQLRELTQPRDEEEAKPDLTTPDISLKRFQEARKQSRMPEACESSEPVSEPESETAVERLENGEKAVRADDARLSQEESKQEGPPRTKEASRYYESSKPAPNFWDAFCNLYQKYLGDRNPIVVCGLLVLFVGFGFLLKYAQHHGYISFSIEARLIGVGLAALVLFVVGWRLQKTRPAYGTSLQGGGIGILYLTVCFAFRTYGLVGPFLAFSVFTVLVVGCGYLAVLHNAISLAVLGISGGLLAPILSWPENQDPLAFFAFYLILNLGIFGIAWHKAWLVLNRVGFFFTFIFALGWGFDNYRPEHFSTIEPFLITFFVLYAVIPVLFAIKRAGTKEVLLDGMLVFGVPLAASALQGKLVAGYEHGMAWSAFAAGVFYLFLSFSLKSFWRDVTGKLIEIFLCLGIIFLALAVPLAFNPQWTAAVWVLSGAGLYWSGHIQKRYWERMLGLLLQFGAGLSFLSALDHVSKSPAIFNTSFGGCVLISLAAFFSSYVFFKNTTVRDGFSNGWILLLWSLCWWFGSGLAEIVHNVPEKYCFTLTLLFFTATAAILEISGRLLTCKELQVPAKFFPYALYVLLFAQLDSHTTLHVFGYGGGLGWCLAILVMYWTLYAYEQRSSKPLVARHVGAFVLVSILLILEARWVGNWLSGGQGEWGYVAQAVAAAFLMLFVTIDRKAIPWPTCWNRDTYLKTCCLPLAAVLCLWSLGSNFVAGDMWPLGYLPILNAIDVTQILVIAALFLWVRTLRSLELFEGLIFDAIRLPLVFGGLSFLWLNAMLARSVHHWMGVRYTVFDLFASAVFQAALSITWGLLALGLVVVAASRKLRPMWLVGAALVAVVVVKLFVVDLSQTETIARIISFVGIGLLMVIIGYLSPLPPDNR